MIKRDISTIDELGNEIIYIDEYTGERRSGIVMYKEIVDYNLAFIYVASPYKEENDKEENGFKYRDIIVFDNIDNTLNGWHRDTILGNYGKYIGKRK